MILYHGTHHRSARQIQREGFLPKPPSRRVWFTQSEDYAKRRARTKARRDWARAVVITCNLDIPRLRARLGSRSVVHKNNIVVISGSVPPSVICHNPVNYTPATSENLARWVNTILGVKPHKGVSPKHPGIERLSRWVEQRTEANPNGTVNETELLQVAQQWLPEFFDRVTVDFNHLRATPRAMPHQDGVGDAEFDPADAQASQEDEALDWLLSDRPKQRIRGLTRLAQLQEPDLFEWCAMFLNDDDLDVQITVLETIAACEDADTDLVYPFTDAEEKRLRAPAVAAMARHATDRAPEWFHYGLTDPSSHVRIHTARQLEVLDPAQNRDIFELALYDSNPKIVEIAQKQTAGRGFAKETW